MDSISGIINSLTESEKDEFIQFIKKKNKRKDVKNISLFESLKTDDIKYTISNFENKPAHYALRKRLYKNLVEFIANKRFESDASLDREVLKLLIVSKFFFEQQQYKAAFKILKKAEEQAGKIERFDLLNEIYHITIEHAYLNPKIDFSKLVKNYQANQKKFLEREQLNLVYASFRVALSKVPDGLELFDFTQTIKTIIAQYNISLQEILSFKSVYQLLFIANEYAALSNNYHEIERFVEESYSLILEKGKLEDRHLFYHINILYFMANVFFRNKKFEASKRYLNKMEVEMYKQERLYFKQFERQLVLLRSLNENYSGNAAHALELLDEVLLEVEESSDSEQLDLQLSRVVFCSQQQNFKSALQTLKKLNGSDAQYEKTKGVDWTIKKNLIEILLHIELKNLDLVHSRILSFKRRYKKHLQAINQERVLVFLSLAEKYLHAPEFFKTKEFAEQVESSFQWKPHRQEDIFVMSFYAWLKAKVEKKNIYEVTLDLVTMD